VLAEENAHREKHVLAEDKHPRLEEQHYSREDAIALAKANSIHPAPWGEYPGGRRPRARRAR